MADPSRRPSELDMAPERFEHGQPHESLSLLVWRFSEPLSVVSSAPLGGGIGPRRWVVNAQVPHAYARLDPEVHLAELASARGLSGPGVGMLTAVDLRHVRHEEDGGAHVDVSVGITFPTWAAAPDEHAGHSGASPGIINIGTINIGTINIVGIVPESLSPAAMVNAVMSVTEAKAQALWEAGVPGTGTASDAVCIACPDSGNAHRFGGPRSQWGARLARAVHRAVLTGCRGGA
ncbi:MAG TPA: adenosylcobinamide amidohydrolase [Acidimicrobiales bacterium]|nr:adenosylcobinamide amidohydrolase [Acidimicrobiales bacterium]